MTRAEILSHALFDTGGEIDGIKFGPLSQPCLVILKRRKNSLLTTSTRDQDDHEAVGEIFFVLSRTKDQRAAMFRDSNEEWDMKTGEFMAGLDDDTLPKFRDDYLVPAMQAVAFAMVESESPGKPQPTRQTSPISSRAQGQRDSSISPQSSGRKTLSGDSPHPPSCNSSTPKRAATAQDSGGSTGRKPAKKASKNLKGLQRKK